MGVCTVLASSNACPTGSKPQEESIQNYYQIHSKIYDVTRWTFLFGRSTLMRSIIKRKPKLILEVGCGTGKYLGILAKQLPSAQLIGVDISKEMLAIATVRHRHISNLNFVQGSYDQGFREKFLEGAKPDIIIFSYMLSMVNPGWEKLVACACVDITDSGSLAMVDFHDTPSYWFKMWMRKNHVEMNGEVLQRIRQRCPSGEGTISSAYLGLWQYCSFIGTPANSPKPQMGMVDEVKSI
jgi:S-adenosylmethionine-diacylgycerolhomoserine-N-methlytransferase